MVCSPDNVGLDIETLLVLLDTHVLIATDEQWRIRHWSNGAVRATGYLCEESIGASFIKRLSAVSADILTALLPTSGFSRPIQLSMIDAHGHKKYFSLQVARQQSGGYLFYGLLDDRSHEIQPKTVNATENLICIDFQGNLIGFSEKHQIFQPYLNNLFSKEEGRQLLESLSKGIISETEALVGNRFYRFNFTPLPAQGYIYIHPKDITDRKLTEEKLRASVNLFRLLSENAQDLICVHSPNGELQYVSQSVYDLLGYEPSQLVSLSPHLFVHPADWIKLARYHRRIIRNRSAEAIQYRIRRSDGTYCWFETIAKAIVSPQNKLIQIQSTSRNIDQRKAFEQKLIEAREEALRSMKAKETFLSTMSHELRTPLNAVVGMTHLLMEENPRPEQMQHLQTLRFAAENLLVLINDILDFSKIEAGKISFENTAFNLRELISSTQNTFRLRAVEKGISFRVKIAKDVPEYVKGDPTRLNQIITNLLSNAIKFTERGKVVMEVKVLQQSAQCVVLHFSVSDTGIGIPEEQHQRIFEYFTQASGDTTRKYGGTGLGLAIVKRLLELQGSQIFLQSKEGKGSCFYFSLAFNKTDERPHKSIFIGSVAPKTLPQELKILLVEDNETNRIVASKFMEKWGIKPDIAINGVQALQAFRQQSYQLILMDLQMPEMDGFQTAAAIRQLEAAKNLPPVPIIALTASVLGDVRNKVIQAGMTDYISKPFHPEELYRKILSHLLPSHLNSTITTTQSEPPTKSSRKRKNQNAVICLDSIAAFAMRDANFERELLQIYLKTFQQLPQQVHTCIVQADTQAMNALLHKVKPTLQSLKAKRIESLLRRILKAISNNEPADNAFQQLVEMSATANELLLLKLQN
ncbi:MAG: ATP-binding protein [Cytophagales bacterium]|nr:ATP-binding protein [Bernardetiaceae bacterium]MDW8205222.1 ATP-binding protein [Cytophagales bacterium]